MSAWYARLRLPFQDEGSTLALAARILRGEVFYRDLDAYVLPGAAYLLAAAMRVLGDDLAVARALAGVVFCGTLLALYAVALRVVDRNGAALFALSLLGMKFLAWPMWTSYFYGDVALCLAFASMALMLHAWREHEVRVPGVAAAGLAAGLSLLCKQNVGIYLALAGGALLIAPGWLTGRAFGPRAPWREAGFFAAGVALPVGAALAAFAASGVFAAMLESAILRPFTTYLTTSAVPYLPMLAWWDLGSVRGVGAATYLPLELWEMLMLAWPFAGGAGALWWTLAEILSRALYASAPLAVVAAVALRLRRRSGSSPLESRLLALAVLALAVFLSAFPRADVLHVLPVLPPMLLVLYALWRRATRARATQLEAVAVAVLLALCAAGAASSAGRRTQRVTLERAEVWVRPANAWNETLVDAVVREIPPGAPFFVYGQEAWLYHLSGRFPPWPFVQLYPGMAGGDGGRALRERLKRDPPRIVVRGMPGLPGLPPLPSYTREVHAFLRERYEVDEDFFRDAPGGAPPPRVVQVLRLRGNGTTPPAPP